MRNFTNALGNLKFLFYFLVLILCSDQVFGAEKPAFVFIDVSDVVNRAFIDLKADDMEGGWADFGRHECFHDLPMGIQTFEDGLIPFQIIDPAQNNGKSSLVLSGPGRENEFPVESKKMMVKGKYASLFFLHTTMYADSASQELLNYRIHYKHGEELVFNCKKDEEIADWWQPDEFLPKAIRSYEEWDKWLITTPWKNPYPEKEIEWIRMESTGNAIPILVAITGSKNDSMYDQFLAKIEGRNEQYQLSFLNIALLQIRSEPDQQWNLEKGTAFCREAQAQGADIALFPEMFNVGYQGVDFSEPDAIDRWQDRAVKQESNFVQHFQDLAKELGMAIAISYLEDIGEDKLPRNSVSLIDRTGKIVFTYAKVHTCEFANLENATTPGDGFFVEALNTKAGPVKIGMMICYDREAPESARILMLNGAEIILTPNACDLNELQLCQFRVRAFENAVATVMTNYGHSEDNKRFNGHSCIFNATGREVLIAGEEEGVYMGTLNIHDIRNYRKRTIWANAYRRPHKYHELVSPEVDEVFERRDSFGKKFERLQR